MAPPRRRLFWILFLTVACLTSANFLGSAGSWPWDDDEVDTLHELQLHGTEKPWLLAPGSQSERSLRVVPLWYWCQSRVMEYLPVNERNVRLFPASCAVLTVLAAFVMGARSQGILFAVWLALLMNTSGLLLDLALQNRFYGLAILMLFLTQWIILRGTGHLVVDILLTAALSVLAIFSHNLILVYFGLGAIAAVIGARLQWVKAGVAIRSTISATTALLLYVGYLRPIVHGWNSHIPQQPLSEVLQSFASDVSVPVIALCIVGAAAWPTRSRDTEFRWWALLALLSIAFIAISPALMYFNSRYSLIFILQFWILAARGIVLIGKRLGGGSPSWAWYACVILLLLPKVLSHYQDGSRKDFRTAAAVVARRAQPGEAVYCNWPQNLGYYLPERYVQKWHTKLDLPPEPFYLVEGTNAWTPPIAINDRTIEHLSIICRRRFDEQSNVVHVYRVGPLRTNQDE